jgi:ankyrin repeat protein
MLLDAKASVNARTASSATAIMPASDYGHLDVVLALIEARADLGSLETERTALHCACFRPENHPIVAALLAAGAAVEPKSPHTTPLSIAILSHSLETMKLLISAGADINGNTYGVLHLAAAVRFGCLPSAKLLVEAKADVNAYAGSRSALFAGITLGDANAVEFLLASGADVSTQEPGGKTCLQTLAEAGTILPSGEWARAQFDETDPNLSMLAQTLTLPLDFPAILRLLLNAKADVSARGPRGTTALMTAAKKRKLPAVEILLEAGADPNAVSDDGRTALIDAASAGCLGSVAALIAAGADVNHSDKRGVTPLYAAVSESRSEICSALITAGADVNYVHDSMTLLDLAYRERHPATLEVLQKAGGEPWMHLMALRSPFMIAAATSRMELMHELIAEASVVEKECALIYAVFKGNLEVVKCLLAAGMSPSVRHDSLSVLLVAIGKGNTEMVRVLVDAGADLTAEWNRVNPVMLAANQKHRDIVVLLVEKAKELKKASK